MSISREYVSASVLVVNVCPCIFSFSYLLVLYLRFFRVFFYSNFRLLCLCSLWIMSLHLYFVFVSVCLCLFVCLLCQCLFVVNIPLCFIHKSSRPFLINSFRSTQRWVVRGSFCTPSTTHLRLKLRSNR